MRFDRRFIVKELWYRVSGRVILKGLSFELRPGVNWIRGPNGAGKTTLLKLIAGAMQPSAGSISFDSTPIGNLSFSQRQRIFFSGAELPDFPWLTAAELIDVYQSIYPSVDAKVLAQYLDLFHIAEISRTSITSLSLGERKKLSLALAFSLDADVLLLDEPFNALDASARDSVIKILSSRQTNKSQFLVVTSHLDLNSYDQLIQL